MKSKRFLPLIAAGALSASASDPIPESENQLNYRILPLAIESDPDFQVALEDFFIENPVVETPTSSFDYKIRIITPDPDIDYKILKVEPAPGIEYKIRIIDPDTRKESDILPQDLRDKLKQKLAPTPEATP